MEGETLFLLSSKTNFSNESTFANYITDDPKMIQTYKNRTMVDKISTSVSYTIVPISKDDGEKVLNFLRKNFFRDEPLNDAIGLLNEPETTCSELEEYCTECISEGLSVMAVSQSGCILGISLNGSITRQNEESTTDRILAKCSHSKFKKILELLTTIAKKSDVFSHFPYADTILDLKILSVDESIRGQGIGKALINKTKEVAQKHKFPVIKVDCTSYYSAKAVSRLGFQCIFTLHYDDYTDNEGKIFNTKNPHTSATTYVLSIDI